MLHEKDEKAGRASDCLKAIDRCPGQHEKVVLLSKKYDAAPHDIVYLLNWGASLLEE